MSLAESAELAVSLEDTDKPNREALIALPVGLHDDVPVDTYHARVRGFAGKGALDLIDKAPAKYAEWLRGGGRAETPALRLGKAVHMAALEPERFRSTYVVAPDFGDCRKTENKQRRDAWRVAHAGSVQLTADEGRDLFGMVASILRHALARPLLTGGRAEMTARWVDRATGLPAKARPDFYREDLGVIVDIKTTEDASPDGFRWSMLRYRYDVQDSFYRTGVGELARPAERFCFLAVEKTPPYLVAVYCLEADEVRQGREAWLRNIETMAECCASNTFPGYGDHIFTLSLPRRRGPR